MTYLEAIRQALFEEMDRDPAVVLLGEDIGVYGGAFKVTEGLLERFGWERVIDTPISESAIVGAAVRHGLPGPAAGGGNAVHRLHRLLLQPDHQFRGQVALPAGARRCRWWCAGRRGGGVHGGPFHSANPEMYFVHTPGLESGVSRRRAYDAKGLLKSAIRDNNPVLFFEHKFLYRRIKEELPDGRLHRADRQSGRAARRARPDHRQLRRHAAHFARSRREAGKGRHRRRSDRPAHAAAARSAKRFSRRCERRTSCWSCTKTRAPAASPAKSRRWSAKSAFEDLDGPIRRVTSLDTPVPYSPPLEEYFLPNAAKVVARRGNWPILEVEVDVEVET